MPRDREVAELAGVRARLLDARKVVRLERLPAAPGEVCAQPPAQIDRLADIQRATLFVAQDVHARRGRRGGADALAGAAPAFAAIFDDKRLSDEPAGKFGRCAADAENFSDQARIIRDAFDVLQPGDKLVTEHLKKRAPAPRPMVTRGARYNGAG